VTGVIGVCANERCAKHFELKRRDSRFCSTVCKKRQYDRAKRPQHRGSKGLPVFDQPFNAFDGEGEAPDGPGSDRMTLLADSTGRELVHPDRRRLTSEECLRFLVDSPKKMANVWYSFGYDVANIVYDLPQEKLKYLREHNRVYYKNFRISWIPNKQFGVTYRAAGCRCKVKIGPNERRSMKCEHVKSFISYDVFGYFQSSFLATMKDWYKTNDPKIIGIIERGKEARGSFDSWSMSDMIEYNRAELVVLNEIMDNFREALRGANYRVNAWSGAGTLAAYWLKREKANQYFGEIPEEMKVARDCAFFGGRIDAGVIGTTQASEGDLQSAYPAQVATLPDLSKLKFVKVKGMLDGRSIGLVHVAWDLPDDVRWGPFPYREADGSTKYPLDGEGWYHAVEVRAALRRFPSIRVIESWESRGKLVYPFADAVRRDYTLRASFKHADPPNPAHVPLKLGLNSLYGKFAQRAGIKELPDGTLRMPTMHNLFYAGMITAGARARVNDAILAHGDENVLKIATDALFVKGEWKVVEPNDMGSWEIESKTASVTIAGAGMYETRKPNGDVNKNKRRGFGGARIDYKDVIRKWRRGERFIVPTRRMVTIGLAANGTAETYAKRATFIDVDREMRPLGMHPFASKRYKPLFPIREGDLELLLPGIRIAKGCSAPYEVFRPRDLKNDDRSKADE
jgi:hypothetical protein